MKKYLVSAGLIFALVGCNHSSNVKVANDDTELSVQTISDRNISISTDNVSTNDEVFYYLIPDTNTRSSGNDTYLVGHKDKGSDKLVFNIDNNVKGGTYKVVAMIPQSNGQYKKITSRSITIKSIPKEMKISSIKIDDAFIIDGTNNLISAQIGIVSTYDTEVNIKAKLLVDGNEYPLSFIDGNNTLDTASMKIYKDVENGFASNLKIDDSTMEELRNIIGSNEIKDLKVEFDISDKIKTAKKTEVVSFYNKTGIEIEDRWLFGIDPCYFDPKCLQERVEQQAAAEEARMKSFQESAVVSHKVIRTYSKNFDKGIGNDIVSADIHVKIYGDLETDKAKALGNGIFNISVYNNNFRFIDTELGGFTQYDSFDKTGYYYYIKVLGYTVLEGGKNASAIDDYEEPEKATLTDEEKNLPIEKQNEILKNRQIENNIEVENKLGVEKDFSRAQYRSRSRDFMIGVIPITATITGGGTIGVKLSAGLVGITKLSFQTTPYAHIDADANAGVGNSLVSGGVGVAIQILRDDMVAEGSIEATFEKDDKYDNLLYLVGKMNESLNNILTGPNGYMYLYIRYQTFICDDEVWGVCYWGHFEEHEDRKSIFSFSSFQRNDNLFNKNQTFGRVLIGRF